MTFTDKNDMKDGAPIIMGQHLPNQEEEIGVHVVTTDEEPVAVPVADSTPLTHKLPQEQSRPPVYSSTNNTVQDSGFDCLLCGDVNVRRLKPGSNVYLSLCGDIYIDLRESNYPPGSTFKLFVLRLCGNIHMIVPRGTQINSRRVLLCGSRNIHVREDQLYEVEPPKVSINALMLCGDIKIYSDEIDM